VLIIGAYIEVSRAKLKVFGVDVYFFKILFKFFMRQAARLGKI
jgi:hypothetical protein